MDERQVKRVGIGWMHAAITGRAPWTIAFELREWLGRWRRGRKLRRFFEGEGLSFSRGDPVGLDREPFFASVDEEGDEETARALLVGHILSEVLIEAHRFANVGRGEHRGRRITAFEHLAEYRLGSLKRSSVRRERESCVMIELPGPVSAIDLEPRNLIDRIATRGEQPDMEFGDKEFDRRYYVVAESESSARELLHAETRRWLLALPLDVRFQVAGDRLIARTDRLRRPRRWPALLDAAHGFRDRLGEPRPAANVPGDPA